MNLLDVENVTGGSASGEGEHLDPLPREGQGVGLEEGICALRTISYDWTGDFSISKRARVSCLTGRLLLGFSSQQVRLEQ